MRPHRRTDCLGRERPLFTHLPAAFQSAGALGYTMARRRGLPFVTGDRAFRDLEGVEFVPAAG